MTRRRKPAPGTAGIIPALVLIALAFEPFGLTERAIDRYVERRTERVERITDDLQERTRQQLPELQTPSTPSATP